jgi:transcriptional regulator of heat shock response
VAGLAHALNHLGASAQPPHVRSGRQASARGVHTFIDQYFDLAQKTLDAQREVAKKLAQAAQSMGEGLRKQAESAGQSTQE